MTADSAVVLGPGGPVGTAWLAGLSAGLRHEGVDLGAADLVVGTSAGAIVGAILAGGGDPGRLAALPAPADLGSVRSDPDALAKVLAMLSDPALERGETLRRVGRLALTASTVDQETAIARMRFLIGAQQWPDRPLLIPSVDAQTGEPAIWDSHGAASLPQAVAASTAFPATSPPITIDGRRYIDGALRAGTNASGHAPQIIISLFPVYLDSFRGWLFLSGRFRLLGCGDHSGFPGVSSGRLVSPRMQAGHGRVQGPR